MANYIFAYHGGNKPQNPEEGKKHMNKWNDWLKQMGNKMVNPGSPLGMSKTVSTDGIADNGGSNPLMGYSIVKAENMDSALEMAKDCPFIEMGTIEVAEVMEMK